MVPAAAEVTPSDWVRQRFEALRDGDYGRVYDSTAADSPFRSHFPSREDYIAHAAAHLAGVVRPLECRVLGERRPRPTVAEVITALRFTVAGTETWLFELARFVHDGDGWRYLSGQKLTPEDYAGAVDSLTFADFDRADSPVSF